MKDSLFNQLKRGDITQTQFKQKVQTIMDEMAKDVMNEKSRLKQEIVKLKEDNYQLRESLKDAIERMNRARRVLTKGEPTLAHNWGILDVSSLRKALRGDDSND